MRQPEMRDENRLRAPQMRIGRHRHVAGTLGLAGDRGDEVRDRLLNRRNPPLQIQAQIDRDLLVPRPSRVKTLAGLADSLDELPLDEGVHVLVRAVDERRVPASRRPGCPAVRS